MKSTTDYSIFKEFSSNRELDEKHVRKLAKAISSRNLLHVNPIIVTEDLRVIDGQHRLAAAKSLNVPIYYISGEVNRRDISKLNSHQKNWNAMDYINFYTIEKIPEFVQFSNLVNHYPKMKVSALLSLSSEDNSRNLTDLKSGFIDVTDIETAKQVSDHCCKLNTDFGYTFVFDSRFPGALKKAIKTKGFDIVNFYRKLSASPRSFVPCHTINEYTKMIEEIYNYKVSKKEISIKA